MLKILFNTQLMTINFIIYTCILLVPIVTDSAFAKSMTDSMASSSAAPNAQNAEKQKIKENSEIMMTMTIYNGNLVYPAPHWISDVKDLGNTKMFRDQTKNTFTFEQIPKNQAFEEWSTLYGVYGWHLPDYDFKRFIAESLNALALGCKEQAKSKLVSAEGGSVVMTYHCAALVDPLVKNGKDTESGFLYMSHVGSSYVKVYQAWRASNKDRGTPAWPINDASITSAIERMKRITYTPRQ
ncbi:hypothetical protein [Nitratidesulfovibrio termitidis]|uniref:hypothetical protein n=1 Tax=Nitratidesulfovibrio termitidis TaxID=42252 RepID=UPI0012EC6AD7|nr:hypothetical protein [Nitratidesulfovibrio termitidis]